MPESESEETTFDTPTGEHPAIIAMRERQEEADQQGYRDGDVNHYVQPIIGQMRTQLRAITEGYSVGPNAVYDVDGLTYMIDRLDRACKAELAWLATHKTHDDSEYDT
jgi:hypothetical protein